ncbi:hypothetical protein QFZ94_000545 [Paraburkholderia sp. JPY465]
MEADAMLIPKGRYLIASPLLACMLAPAGCKQRPGERTEEDDD